MHPLNTETQLGFCLLNRPPSKKLLQTFYKEAEWLAARDGFKKAPKSNVKEQWVSVELKNVQIGVARLALAAPEFCYISHLVIRGKYRGKGVGRWFIKSIETYCSKLGIKRLLLEPEGESLPFYQAISFVPDPFVEGILKKEISVFQMKKVFTETVKGK
ncbi:MAG: GNAT family N-acetyltransferase [Gallionellaceae bacterium]